MSYGFTDDESMMDGVLGFLNSALEIYTHCAGVLTHIAWSFFVMQAWKAVHNLHRLVSFPGGSILWIKIYSAISRKLRSKENPAILAAPSKYLGHPKLPMLCDHEVRHLRCLICVFRFRRQELGKFAFISTKKRPRLLLGTPSSL
jgi:hypothetical protein